LGSVGSVDTDGDSSPAGSAEDVSAISDTELKLPAEVKLSTVLTPEARAKALAAIERLVADLGCARLSASLSPDRVVTLRGFLENENDLKYLHTLLLEMEHVERIQDNEVQVFGWPFCRIIASLDDALKGADAATGKVSILFNKKQPRYREGEYLVVKVLNNSRRNGFLYLDYIDLAGDLVHMLPTSTERGNRITGWGEVVVGADDERSCLDRQCYEISPPHGRSMVIAVWSSEPLFSGPRDRIEEQTLDYVSELATRIRDRRPSEITMSYRFLETRP
jgi:hypothetical protein